jgi:hypothetical protein
MPSVTPGISQGGLEIVTIPCLSDNYAYLVKGPDGVCLSTRPRPGPSSTRWRREAGRWGRS